MFKENLLMNIVNCLPKEPAFSNPNHLVKWLPPLSRCLGFRWESVASGHYRKEHIWQGLFHSFRPDSALHLLPGRFLWAWHWEWQISFCFVHLLLL
jgi:hypothetical protein